MKKINIKLKNTDIYLEFNGADDLYENICRCFTLEPSAMEDKTGPDGKEHISIRITGVDGNYNCSSLTEEIIVDSERQVIAWLLDMVGESIIMTIPPDEMIMHAAAVEKQGQVIIIAGDSGSGKTSFSLILNRYGFRYIGDEYIHITPGNGKAYGDNYPVHLKAGNPLLQTMEEEDLVETYNEETGRSGYAFSFDDMGGKSIEADVQTGRISAIIFVKYIYDASETYINRMSIHNLPQAVLGTLIAHGSRTDVLRRFVRMIAEYEIPIMERNYSKTEKAVRLIFNLLARTNV